MNQINHSSDHHEIYLRMTNRKKTLSILIAFHILLFTATFAQFAGGSGTSSDPYQIGTAAQLAELATVTNAGDTAFNNKHYKLIADIDLSVYGPSNIAFNDGEGWIPIGFSEYVLLYFDSCGYSYAMETEIGKPFKGNFNGNNKIVSGLYIEYQQFTEKKTIECVGLFGYIDGGMVENLGIVNGHIIGRKGCGSVAGYINNGSNITNCYFTGLASGNNTGGVVGSVSNNSSVTSCYSVSSIGGYTAGGVTGSISDTSSITNCYSIGTVSGGSNAGGVTGIVYNNCSITNCYSMGMVNGYFAGGVAGFVSDNCNITNCYSTSIVVSDYYSTYLVAGGVASFLDNNSIITNCVALNPSVKGFSDYTGRVLGGSNNDFTLSNNAAWDGMLNKADDTIWNNKGCTNRDGKDMSTVAINADGTLGGRFTAADGWTTQNGKLPGLFGNTVDMPVHLLTTNRLPNGAINATYLKISPNPTTGELRVTSDKLPMEDIQIFDVLGRRLPFYQEKNEGEMKTDISHLAAGVYFLQVDGIIRKVIKN